MSEPASTTRAWSVAASVTWSALLFGMGCHNDTSLVGCDADELDIVEVRTRNDVVDLPRAETIRELHIVESDLDNLSGFECLKKTEKIVIERNATLRSLEGLGGLTDFALFDVSIQSKGAEFSIASNPELPGRERVIG